MGSPRQTMYSLFVVILLSAFSLVTFAASDIYGAMNRMRAGEAACAPPRQALAPLTQQPALERAAAALARGKTLRDSLHDAGYRSTRAVYFSLVGDDVSARAASLLEKKYCAQLLDDALVDIGIYQDARQVWIIVAAPFAPRVSLAPEAAARRVLELTNEARAQSRHCGDRMFRATRPLRWSATLAKAGLLHAEDMAQHDFLDHPGNDGSTPAERVERVGYAYRATGENIAGGPTTPEAVVASWIKSPSHCATLMNPVYSEMAVAYAIDRNSRFGVYWTQVFGAPR